MKNQLPKIQEEYKNSPSRQRMKKMETVDVKISREKDTLQQLKEKRNKLQRSNRTKKEVLVTNSPITNITQAAKGTYDLINKKNVEKQIKQLDQQIINLKLQISNDEDYYKKLRTGKAD